MDSNINGCFFIRGSVHANTFFNACTNHDSLFGTDASSDLLIIFSACLIAASLTMWSFAVSSFSPGTSGTVVSRTTFGIEMFVSFWSGEEMFDLKRFAGGIAGAGSDSMVWR